MSTWVDVFDTLDAKDLTILCFMFIHFHDDWLINFTIETANNFDPSQTKGPLLEGPDSSVCPRDVCSLAAEEKSPKFGHEKLPPSVLI